MADEPTTTDLAKEYPEPRTLEEATTEATMRNAIASGIHWGSRSRAMQRREGIDWIGGTEWTMHLAMMSADVYVAVALRILEEVGPEWAQRFAHEVHVINQSGEAGEVLWDLAERYGVDAQAIHDAALAAVSRGVGGEERDDGA